MSRAEMEQALKRPLDHAKQSAAAQWATDKRLGILDWDPDKAEAEDYIRRRAAMGDEACQVILDKEKADASL